MHTARPAIDRPDFVIIFGCRENCTTIKQFDIVLCAYSADFRQTWSKATFNRRAKGRGMKILIAVKFCFPAINVQSVNVFLPSNLILSFR